MQMAPPGRRTTGPKDTSCPFCPRLPDWKISPVATRLMFSRCLNQPVLGRNTTVDKTVGMFTNRFPVLGDRAHWILPCSRSHPRARCILDGFCIMYANVSLLYARHSSGTQRYGLLEFIPSAIRGGLYPNNFLHCGAFSRVRGGCGLFRIPKSIPEFPNRVRGHLSLSK